MGLFFSLLLNRMPLHRVQKVWRPKLNDWRAPENTTPVKFHRLYASKFNVLLGESPSLWRWRQSAISFLVGKLPTNVKNDFKWANFTMTLDEIVCAATDATYQFGMERMGYQ